MLGAAGRLRLSAGGLLVDIDIGVVALTHLHFDHAGWAFTRGAKTFPNARYVLSAREWASSIEAPDPASLELIDDDAEIIPGVRALVTGGHTPGHTAYVITSRSGRRLIAFGDAFHLPAQLAHPDWLSSADADPADVPAARRRLIDELSAPDTVGFGFHFGDQAFGRFTGGGLWDPVPTSKLERSTVSGHFAR